MLTTINARYQHASLGLRYLFANLGKWQAHTKLMEFTLEHQATDIVEAILRENPKAVGFGVYIWNVQLTTEAVEILKKVAPHIRVVVGGPEVSFEIEGQPLCRLVDAVIPGEAEERLRLWCDGVLGEGAGFTSKIVVGPPPEISAIKLPYHLYTDEDVAHRVIYVEASRGCAYRCEFCLSALDEKVRLFSLEAFLGELQILIERGARQFKFVDRTFNLSIPVSTRILDFFLERLSLGLFLHFEMVPERLPEELKERIRKFPKGALQFEVGIQTWNPEVSKGISRPQNYAKIEENLIFLRSQTDTHLHTDLIVGLPGENVDSFGVGFDALNRLRPHEIQVGILKRLRGMPLNRQIQTASLLFSEMPPYSILSTNSLTFVEVQELKRFAKFWELIANRGQLPRTLNTMRLIAAARANPSFFVLFRELCQWLGRRHPKLHSIGLPTLIESIWLFFKDDGEQASDSIGHALAQDYSAEGKRYLPPFLRPYAPADEGKASQIKKRSSAVSTPSRQQRHSEFSGQLEA